MPFVASLTSSDTAVLPSNSAELLVAIVNFALVPVVAIAPPFEAVLSLNVPAGIESSTAVLMPPPLPALASLFVTLPLLKVSVPPAALMPPPLPVVASLYVIVAFSTVKVPALRNTPPPFAAVLPWPVVVSVPLSASVVVVEPPIVPLIVTVVVPPSSAMYMPPPFSVAVLLLIAKFVSTFTVVAVA